MRCSLTVYAGTVAYDEDLAERIRVLAPTTLPLAERKMFGGLCFMINGNMCFGIVGDELMVRVGPNSYVTALARAHAREMDFNGRPMKGFVYVAAPGLRSDRSLTAWLARGLSFAESLPAK